MTPEQIHVALNHLTIIGMGLAVIPLLIGIFSRNRPTLVAGLIMVSLCGWSTGIVLDSGEEAYERYEEASNHGIPLDAEVHKWMEAHEDEAESLSIVMFVAAGFATLALVLCIVHAGGAFVLSWIVVLLSLASLAAGILIASSGGKIRRPDFRAEADVPSFTEDVADAGHRSLDLFT